MNNKELVSVIIPTFNRADYISDSIDSVLNQSIPSGFDLEVIIVDDGSTDDTEKIIRKKYAKNVKYKKIKHSGKPAASRNAGLDEAKGTLIAFQDSDDIWTEGKLEKSLKAFDDSSVIGVYGNAGYINDVGEITPNKRAIAENGGVEGDIFFYLTSRNKPSFPTPTIILRKDIMDRVGAFNDNLIIATDTEYWIRYSTQGKFKYVDDILCYVRRHKRNISSVPSEEGLRALYKHEVNRINMYEQIIAGGLLSGEQEEAMNARLVELHLYVSELSQKLGESRANEHQENYSREYRKTLKKYYGDLPNQATGLGVMSGIKRVLLKTFPSLYSRAVKLYKSLRED